MTNGWFVFLTIVVGGLIFAFMLDSDFVSSAVWLALAIVVFIGGWALIEESAPRRRRR